MYKKLYDCYESVQNFADFHQIKIKYWSYSRINKSEDKLNDKLFSVEIQKNGFIVVILEPIAIAIVSNNCLNNINNTKKLINVSEIIKTDIIILYESTAINTKLNALMSKNKKFRKMLVPIFMNNPLNSIYAPEFELIDKSELNKIYLEPKQLMEISVQDPCVIWMMYKVGDLLMIKNKNMVIGYDVGYRRVV